MRIFLWLLFFVLLAIIGFLVHLILEQGRQVASYSVKTTAMVVGKRLEVRVSDGHPGESSTHSYEPVVNFRYEAQGRQFTGDHVFPGPFRTHGQLRIGANALLERFQVGEETSAYYNPNNLSEACLIRRPAILPYLFMLLPVIAVSGLVAGLWRSPEPGAIEFKRRKSGCIAVFWHIVGVASAVHYFGLAGAEYGGGALALFSVYTQLGLIPLAFALPPSKTSGFDGKIESGIVGSFLGTFIGFWLGLVVAFVAMGLFSASATVFLQCWGYGTAIPAVLFFLSGLFGLMNSSSEPEERKRQISTKKAIARGPTPSVNSAPRSEEFVSISADIPIPYQIDHRPMPSGEDLETLLPVQIGPFHRAEMDQPNEVRNKQIYAEYRSDEAEFFSDRGKITVELGVCEDPATAQMGVETSKLEFEASFPDAGQVFSLQTEPSFFMNPTPRQAFFSWTRGRYYFSAYARSGGDDLNRFMEAFPY